ncbi:8013_t:CDS:2 [Rhizophagus irregularis]|nr:8013_t:CDS:2 [Rhizophagus irregularis]
MTQVAGQTPNHNNELSKDEEQIEESSPSLLGMKVPSKKQSGNSRQNGRVTRQTKTKNELETTAIKNSQKRVALVQGERKITERMSQVAT